MNGQSANELVMDVIVAFRKQHDRMPTTTEIWKATPFQTTARVCYCLKRLAELGAIKRNGTRWEQMTILDASKAKREVKQKATGGYYTSSAYKMPRGNDLNQRIEMVVKLAKTKEKLGLSVSGEDVVRHIRPGNSWSRMRVTKLG